MVSASVFLLFVHRQSVITGMSLHSLRNSLGTELYVVGLWPVGGQRDLAIGRSVYCCRERERSVIYVHI